MTDILTGTWCTGIGVDYGAIVSFSGDGVFWRIIFKDEWFGCYESIGSGVHLYTATGVHTPFWIASKKQLTASSGAAYRKISNVFVSSMEEVLSMDRRKYSCRTKLS